LNRADPPIAMTTDDDGPPNVPHVADHPNDALAGRVQKDFVGPIFLGGDGDKGLYSSA